jgi:dienelactone hydrolase
MVTIRQSVEIPQPAGVVHGDLESPDGARGVVVFAHGSGSSRFSPRNREVAATLRSRGLATLLMDLLTREEDEVDQRTAEHRFDIDLLAGRLVGAAEWLAGSPLGSLPVGFFGASTGAAAALVAAAGLGDRVAAVVSRGGRPDLAGDALPAVTAPTLLIVGGRDDVVIDLNRQAAQRMTAEHGIEIVPGATHLFEEPGTLDRVSTLAGDWFLAHLTHGPDPP